MKTVANLACYPLEPPLKNFLIRRSRIRPLTRKCSMIFRKSLNIKIIARITAFEFLDKSIVFPLFTFDHSF